MSGYCIPITAQVAHVGVAAGVVFSAIIKENGVVVGNIFVAAVSNVDPGIDGAESIFGYKFVLVKEVGGGDPYIIEQVASLVVVHCFSTFIVCFFEWCAGVCCDVDGGNFWGSGSIVYGVVGGSDV